MANYKKIILKKQSYSKDKDVSKSYKISYATELNESQYSAVMHTNGPALVIAGAGTGKTRTLVYRVSRLIEDGVPPESILLLTFTRKAAGEMLRRASQLLDVRAQKVTGGTFHSFAMQTLRRFAKSVGYDSTFTVLDQSDSEDVINLIRTQLNFDKSSKWFPKKTTLGRIISFSNNTRTEIDDIIEKDYPRYRDFKDEINFIASEYGKYKKKANLMDYDDLLLNLKVLLKENEAARKELNSRYKFVMVDEYQDSNRLQHEIVLLLGGKSQNIMAVGDDAQSIYAFRGANFQNIMFFPESFSDCKLFKIEENYRSTPAILDFTNQIIEDALFKYKKKLYTQRKSDLIPKIISCGDERLQSLFIVQQVLEFSEQGIPLSDMAVLFRNAFHSFDLEIEIENANIPFKKFGGLKFIETAHIKDILAYLKVMQNPKDSVSWQRILLLIKGVGPRTASKIIDLIDSNKISLDNYADLPSINQKSDISELFEYLSELSEGKELISDKIAALMNYYKPLLQEKHDDWQKRWRDLDSFLSIAEKYNTIQELLNDMAIDPPNESVSEVAPESKEDDYLSLSTIHSAKGLEWKVVFIIWALEGRFPSAKAVDNVDSVEEERRLFYVAATRAKDELFISYPINIYDRESGFVLSEPSRFIANIDEKLADKFVVQPENDEEDDLDLPKN